MIEKEKRKTSGGTKKKITTEIYTTEFSRLFLIKCKTELQRPMLCINCMLYTYSAHGNVYMLTLELWWYDVRMMKNLGYVYTNNEKKYKNKILPENFLLLPLLWFEYKFGVSR